MNTSVGESLGWVFGKDNLNLRILNWNVEWRQRHIPDVLRQLAPDIICLTEGRPRNIPFEAGRIITSQLQSPAASDNARCKVVMWSRWGWSNVDAVGSPDLPEGRFIAAQTTPPNQPSLTIIGVVIPYQFYRTDPRWGEQRLKVWQGTERYLTVLADLLKQPCYLQHTLVVGDFNLEIPRRRRTPIKLDQLRQTAFDGWMIPTSGDQRQWAVYYVDAPALQAKIGPTAIDHLAHTPDFTLHEIWRWSRYKADGTHLSDHDGMVVTLATEG